MTGPATVDLVDAVLAAADAHPADPAIGRMTYGRLAARVRSTSAGLRDAGLRDGDRVLFSVRPGADAVVLALAIVHAGGTVVFADPGAGESLFRARAALAAPRWVAAESMLYLASSGPLRPLARRRGLELAPYARLVPEARHIYAGPWLPGVPRGATRLRRWGHARSAHGGPEGDRIPESARGVGIASESGRVDSELQRAALIVFTSGTTDAPKAVVHTRGSLGAGLAAFAAGVGIRPRQRVLTDQLMVGIPALIAGAHWVLPPTGANPGARPEQYLRLLPETELLFAVPATLDALLRALDARPELMPRRLDTIVVGGAPVLRPLLERAFARFPDATVRAVYGMTEILPVAIADGREKLAELDAAGIGAGGGDPVGRIAAGVTARIDAGELVLAGPGLARGYLGQPALTELRTGDLARLDGERLTLLGRAKDMFIRGTQNVYPALYEPIIAGLPGVADAAMAGLPDAIGDDRIVVAIVPENAAPPHPTTAHPLAVAVARALPGLIDVGVLPDAVVVLSELPRAGRSRKLDRAALADLLAPVLR
jgi:acyl-CoA synthetase (AMP-forming)/AMP-acid ligase II